MMPKSTSRTQTYDFARFTGTYVGMDMSLTSTGLAVLRGGALTTHHLQAADLRGPERLEWYRHQLREFLYPLEGCTVCLEDYAFNKGNRAHQIGELGGLVRTMLWGESGTSYLVAPATLKKFVTGSGKGGKTGIPLHLFKRWGLTVDQEDEADATGLALMALYSNLNKLDHTKAQAEAVAKMSVLRASPNIIRSRSRKK